MKTKVHGAAEFSRIVDAESVGEAECVLALEAAEAERGAIAGRLGLLGLERLTGSARLRWNRRQRELHAHVTYEADVVQSCVVTLEPVTSRIEESFELVCRNDEESEDLGREMEIGVEGDEEFELLVDGGVDLGELVVQRLALAVDPYPRAPGVSFDGMVEGKSDGGSPRRENPFEVLRGLKEQG